MGMRHVMGVVDGFFDQDRQLALATGEYAQLRSRMRPRAPTSARTYARAPKRMEIGGLCTPQATMKDKNKRFGEVRRACAGSAGWDALMARENVPWGVSCRLGFCARGIPRRVGYRAE